MRKQEVATVVSFHHHYSPGASLLTFGGVELESIVSASIAGIPTAGVFTEGAPP